MKIDVSIGAGLVLSGPPFSGRVYFEIWVVNFHVDFGPAPSPPRELSLDEFVDVLQKDGNSGHVFAIQTGIVITMSLPISHKSLKSRGRYAVQNYPSRLYREQPSRPQR